MSKQKITMLGASARAACFSAERSSYQPYWLDQYGDHDLVEKYQGNCVAENNYPEAFIELLAKSPDQPFMFTGAMENHLQVLAELERHRPLLGNSAERCRAVRDPLLLSDCFLKAGIKYPKIYMSDNDIRTASEAYLSKPLRSAGGMNIHFHAQTKKTLAKSEYLQEFIAGQSMAAVFVGNGRSACLLGVTRQLIGEDFLHAGAFSYCGSVGPLQLTDNERQQWQNIGDALATEFALLGLFGVDAIRTEEDIYPVEVNPRYTASVEVVERMTGLALIALHCRACEGELPSVISSQQNLVIGKAYLFADRDLRSPEDVEQLYLNNDESPLSADIPQAGRLIPQGHPVMTVLAEGDDHEQVVQTLKSRAKLLYGKFNVV